MEGCAREERGEREDSRGRSATKPDSDDDSNDTAIVDGAATAGQRRCLKLSLQPSKEAVLLRDGGVAS